MPKFINTESKSNSESDSDLDSEKIGVKADNELMPKLEKSGSNSYSVFVWGYIFKGIIF